MAQMAPHLERVRAVVAPPWQRFKQWRDRQKLWQRIAAVQHWRLIFVIIFLVAFVAPLLTLGASAYVQYSQLKNWGVDGVNQLTAIKTLLPTSSATSGSSSTGTSATLNKAQDILNKVTLTKIKQHCLAAQSDFMHINNAIANRDGVIGIAMGTSYRNKILAVQQLALIGIDATVLCDELTNVGMEFTNSFKTSPFSTDGGPLLTTQSFADLQQGLTDSQVLLTDIQAHVKHINLNDLPVSASQRAQVAKYLPYIPTALNDISAIQPYMPLAGWIVGVDSTRHYLIQTMDRGELRPTGGFNGQWAVLSLNGGRMGKLSLADVTFIDKKSDNSPTLYQHPPTIYRSWWPFDFNEWGVRDGDLSGDFPTSAKIIMQSFVAEETAAGTLHNPDVLGPTGTTLDGDIHLSPLVIEHLLVPSILGPITVPCYNDTITSTNLEEKLHYYQEEGLIPGTPPYILQNKCSAGKTGTTSLRKRFTSALFDILQTKIKGASQKTLLAIVDSLRHDLLTKDLEIYVTNPQIESLLTKDHLDGSIITNAKVDATSIIQANISVNKASTFVTQNINEYISLDDQGGAYHDLVISLAYQPDLSQPWLFPLQTYRDYMRVYVPPQAQFYGGSGFDQNIDPMYNLTISPQPQKPLCVAQPTPPPPVHTPTPVPGKTPPPQPTATPPPVVTGPPYPCTPAEAPSCPAGKYIFPGPASDWVEHTQGSNSKYIDDIGGPTNFVSDIQDRAMFGGLIVIPMYCTANIELKWYVPGVAGTGAKHNLPYSFTFQRQSGTFPNYEVQIVPAQDAKIASIDKKVPLLGQDTTWTLSPLAAHLLLANFKGLGLITVAALSLDDALWKPNPKVKLSTKRQRA